MMFEGGRRNLEQEEQLCLKKSGKTSVPLWFCLLRERARGQALGQEAIHFVWGRGEPEARMGSEGCP